MLKKLRRRFVLINMAIVTGMLLIIFGLLLYFTGMNLESQSQATLQKLIQPGVNPDILSQEIHDPYIVIEFSPLGQLVHGRTAYDIENPEFLNELLMQVNTGKGQGYIEKYNMIYAVSSGVTYQIVAFLDISGNADTLTSLLYISLITGLIALIAFAVISILLARWAVKPVDKAWQQQKQFVSDASHELKTPLTVILSNAELLQGADCDEESKQKYSQNVLSAGKQMRHLVEGLLELARADNGQIRSHFEDADFSRLVSDSVLPFEPVFFENGMQLQASIEPGICIKGSPLHLRQLTDILLDNAQKYSSPGIVDIALRRQGRNQAVLTVSNPGIPIAQEDLDRIFERFYRADDARSNTGSFGLGLSIAQRITEEHGGDIWAESNPTGNRFTVLLPCNPQ